MGTALDIFISRAHQKVKRATSNYEFERRVATTFEERDKALHKANLAVFKGLEEVAFFTDFYNRWEEEQYDV